MDKYGLIGYPLKHSFSIVYFNEKFKAENIDAEYVNFEIPRIEEFMEVVEENPNLCGLNVTIPYKEQVIPYLDELDKDTAKIGAVNVIKIIRQPKGKVKLVGYNSDIIGFTRSIEPLLKPDVHTHALILGTGGASKAIFRGLENLGIKSTFVSRTKKNDEVMTYEEYMAADLDTQVTVATYVQAKQSWWEDQATVYSQDEDGAYFLYNMACSEEDYEKLVPGTKIIVTGYKSEWSGEVEIIDATFTFADDGEEFIALPIDVTDMLGTDDLINHQNQLVTFSGLTVEAAGQDEDGNDVAFLYNWDGSGTDGDDLYFNASYNGETYTFTIESYLCDNTTEVYSAVKNLEIGQTIDMEGFLYWYEGVNPHITAVTVVE